LGLHHAPSGEIGQADVADRAFVLLADHPDERFCEVVAGVAVQVEQVDLFHAEPLSRRVEIGLQLIGFPDAVIGDFGGDIEIIALGLGEVAEDRFRRAICIDICGVEMGDARIAAGRKHGGAGAFIGGAAELHCAKRVVAGMCAIKFCQFAHPQIVPLRRAVGKALWQSFLNYK
jgi:hypothetical protein